MELPGELSIVEHLARQEEREALYRQMLRDDATRARAEFTEALHMLRDLTGESLEALNTRVARRLADKKGPSHA